MDGKRPSATRCLVIPQADAHAIVLSCDSIEPCVKVSSCEGIMLDDIGIAPEILV